MGRTRGGRRDDTGESRAVIGEERDDRVTHLARIVTEPARRITGLARIFSDLPRIISELARIVSGLALIVARRIFAVFRGFYVTRPSHGLGDGFYRASGQRAGEVGLSFRWKKENQPQMDTDAHR